MKQQLNNRISFVTQEPQNVRLMYCPACKINTNHHRTASNTWVCWCGHEIKPEPENGSILEQRQETILYEVARDPGLLTNDVVEELADLSKEIDGGAQ